MGIASKELRVYEKPSGKRPFEDWLFGIRDKAVVARIVARLNRVAHGNMGDVKGLGNGLSELRLAFGPGYRVYFAFDGDTLVVLLSGGDKGSQVRDIKQARQFLEDYRSRT
ncbi:MAG: type II toxin-antitoxin system RelE/ParE family toxin [Bdellovibrionales bacterium]|nr:type II toxin-antitoxin system RelE/ParE family toxin [Bdellovibrionales bacterium]